MDEHQLARLMRIVSEPVANKVAINSTVAVQLQTIRDIHTKAWLQQQELGKVRFVPLVMYSAFERN